MYGRIWLEASDIIRRDETLEAYNDHANSEPLINSDCVITHKHLGFHLGCSLLERIGCAISIPRAHPVPTLITNRISGARLVIPSTGSQRFSIRNFERTKFRPRCVRASIARSAQVRLPLVHRVISRRHTVGFKRVWMRGVSEEHIRCNT